jgi:glycerate kinase
MHVLIAPNAFKHSLDAEEVASAIQLGLIQSNAQVTCECFPVGDGGDGTGFLIIKRLGGFIRNATVHDAIGREIPASIGLIDNGETAVIEMADASGIRLLKSSELDPMRASSFGTGELIKVALDYNVKKIIIGMGGSATVDGGAGILLALGIRFLNAKGKSLATLPEDLIELDFVDTSGLDIRLKDCEIIVLCDVDNMLLGENGSAAVFGPQKGASPEVVVELDRALSRLSAVAFDQLGKDMRTIKYGGTAGGAAAGLFAFLNAKLVNGIDYFLELTDFSSALDTADLVITGEGSIDEQTLQGKGPYGVACHAKLKGIPVIGIAGRVPLETNTNLQQFFNVLMPIGNQPEDLATAISCTKSNLVRTSESLGSLLALVQGKKTISSIK